MMDGGDPLQRARECEGYGGQVTFLWIEVQVMITSSDDNDKHERRTVMSNEIIRRDET